MNSFKIRQIAIKKAQMLIDKKIGDIQRLEQIQMKLARGLPVFTENQAYINALILEHLSPEEVQSIVNEVEAAKLEKPDNSDNAIFHCICCGNATRQLEGGGMCSNCYLDYNIKISKFISKPFGGGVGITF